MPKGVYKHKSQSKEANLKNRLSHLGKRLSEETKRKISDSERGKFVSEEIREKISIALRGGKKSNRGEKHHWWRGGITPINIKIRMSLEYKLWRTAVYERDNFTCIWCGYRGNKLQADHIKPFSLFPELRFAIDNGRTLCKNCHRKTDTYGVHD